MKILQISPYNFPKGGSDRYFLELSQLLESHGLSVYKFCTNINNTDTEYLLPSGIDTSGTKKLDAFRSLYNLESRKLLDLFLDAHPIDVAHLHIYYGHFSTSVLAPLCDRGIPIVQTCLLYTSPSPRDRQKSRMPSSA